MASSLESAFGVYPNTFQSDMQKIGYTKIAATLAFEGLRQKKLADSSLDLNCNDDQVEVIKTTDAGRAWCMANQHRFVLQQRDSRDDGVDDIPF